jgi:hypothetical protein
LYAGYTVDDDICFSKQDVHRPRTFSVLNSDRCPINTFPKDNCYEDVDILMKLTEFLRTMASISDVIPCVHRDLHGAVSIWRIVYWRWLCAVQLLASEGYPVELVLASCKLGKPFTTLVLKNVPLLTRLELRLQQDGAPPHFRGHVTSFFDQHFKKRWIGW